MKRQLCSIGIALACATTLRAQDRSATPPPAATPAGATIVVQGCLQNADKSGSLGGTPLGTSATPANAGDIANNQELPLFFILTDARPAGRANAANAGIAVGTAGTARTRTADGNVTAGDADDAAPRTYGLIGNQNELAVHNGHRVEITGTLTSPVRSSGRNGGAPQIDVQAADVGAGGGAQAPRADNNPGSDAFQSGTERITVASVRPIANSCDR